MKKIENVLPGGIAPGKGFTRRGTALYAPVATSVYKGTIDEV